MRLDPQALTGAPGGTPDEGPKLPPLRAIPLPDPSRRPASARLADVLQGRRRKSGAGKKVILAVAVAAGVAGSLWHYSAVRADNRRLRQEVEQARQQVQELKAAGYLEPFAAEFVVAPPDRLVVAGWAHAGVVERVEVVWDDAPGSKPEVLYSAPAGPGRERPGPVSFSGSRPYRLDGSPARPRVVAVPFADAGRVLQDLHHGRPPLEVAGSFVRAPTGLAAPDKVAAFTDAEAARWAIARVGGLTVRLPSGETVRADRPEDLPAEAYFAYYLRLRKPVAGGKVGDDEIQKLRGLRKLHSLDAAMTGLTDAGMESVGALASLRRLNIADCPVTDAGLVALRDLHSLEDLDVQNTRVGDPGLGVVRHFPQLKRLVLRNTRVTDAGLEHLAPASRLETLDLIGTGVTDAGLNHLHGLKNLKTIELYGTRVTLVGAQELRRALPKCQVKGVN
jgi:hypothetical protein